jgi:hypothetical protein
MVRTCEPATTRGAEMECTPVDNPTDGLQNPARLPPVLETPSWPSGRCIQPCRPSTLSFEHNLTINRNMLIELNFLRRSYKLRDGTPQNANKNRRSSTVI